MSLKAGEWVEVRDKEEILRTLDANGRLDGMPFMPGMFQHCGKRFRVFKRAHKTCGGVIAPEGFKLEHTVHLDGLRCDGKAHGGCQAECLLFWKEAWLKPPSTQAGEPIAATGAGCAEADIERAISTPDPQTGEPIYRCQATTLLDFAKPLKWWDVRQYVEDYTSRNVSLARIARGLTFAAYAVITRAQSPKWGAPFRWLYDRLRPLWNGVPYPRRRGRALGKAPRSVLKLQPGDWVRVKPYEEILETLDSENKNRGLFFDPELAPYCGGVFRVRARVERFVDEVTGKLTVLRTDAIMLEDVWCRAHFAKHRWFCPRAIYSWWRECWLERVSPGSEDLRRSQGVAGVIAREGCPQRVLTAAE
jgi:hypothetical protein